MSVASYPRIGGETDDAPRIQRAIDAVVSAGGGEVFFPSGDYELATSQNTYSPIQYLLIDGGVNLTLRGTGPASRLRTSLSKQPGSYSSSDPILLTLRNGSSNVVIRDLAFVGMGKSYGSEDSDWGAGVVIYNSNYVTIRDCTFSELNSGTGKGYGFSQCTYIDNKIFGKIAQDAIFATENCIVRGNLIDGGPEKTIGMGVRVAGKQTVVAENIIKNTVAEPIVVEGSGQTSLSIANNIVVNRGYGIVARHMETSTIIGNAITGAGVLFEGGGMAGRPNWPVIRNVVIGNTTRDSAGQAFYAAPYHEESPVGHNLISGNMFSNAGNVAMQVQPGADHTTVIGNYVVNPASHAVAWDSNDGMFLGNTFDQLPYAGIWTPATSSLVGFYALGNKFTNGDGWHTHVIHGTGNPFIALDDVDRSYSGPFTGTSTRQMTINRVGRFLGLNVTDPGKTMDIPSFRLSLMNAPLLPWRPGAFLIDADPQNTLNIYDSYGN